MLRSGVRRGHLRQGRGAAPRAQAPRRGWARPRDGRRDHAGQRRLHPELLDKKYVPVISPVGLGEDGEGYNINADCAAAEIAVALRAEKLIYLTDVAGILDQGEPVSEIKASEVRDMIAQKKVSGGMVAKAKSALSAIERGVASVHIIDGRMSHSVIAELFTDRGVGTLITRKRGE